MRRGRSGRSRPERVATEAKGGLSEPAFRLANAAPVYAAVVGRCVVPLLPWTQASGMAAAIAYHLVIQIVRLSSVVGAQFTGTFSLALGETEVGYKDDALSGEVVESPEEVSRLRRMFEMLRKHALSEAESLCLIREVAEAWKAKI